jgi:nucleotide-binding universal stress UspA family protein
MIERVLLAVDDSPDSLAAARLAVAIAGQLHARLRTVHVSADHVLDAAVAAATGRPGAREGRHHSAAAILMRVASLANAAGVDIETELLAGDVATAVLNAARTWPADLVILGKSARSLSGEPYVGAQTRHILEFADQPVLVVPPVHPPLHGR